MSKLLNRIGLLGAPLILAASIGVSVANWLH